MTMTTERRNFLKGVSAAAASTAVLAGTQALAQGNPLAGAKAMPYQAKPMPFDPKTITGISEKVLVSHYENNYVGAVKRLNAIGTQLAELDFAQAPNFVINGLKREELVASNSMILHEIYFDGLGGGAKASGPLADAITHDFGSMERWRSEFAAMGKAEGGGSGWVILAYSPRDKRLVNQWAADHTTTLAGGRPVLVLDMYEHAYHMDYGAAAARLSTSIWKLFAGTTPPNCTSAIAGKLRALAVALPYHACRDQLPLAHSGHSSLNAGCSQVDTWFSRPEAAHSLPRFPRFKSMAPPERRGIYASCGSRADEVGIYSISLSEPRPRFGWFALQPTSCR